MPPTTFLNQCGQLLLPQLLLETGPEFRTGTLGAFKTQEILNRHFGILIRFRHEGESGAKVFAEFALQELLGVVEPGTDRAFSAAHNFGNLRVAEAIDFE